MARLFFLWIVQLVYHISVHSASLNTGTSNRGDANVPSYNDYEKYKRLPLHPGLCRSSEDYWLLRHLGSGKFSDVFEALEEKTNDSDDNKGAEGKLVVIKVLKPIRHSKVQREISVMMQASKLPNIVRLLGVVTKYENNGDVFDLEFNQQHNQLMPALVIEHAGENFQWFCHGFGRRDSSIQSIKDALSANETKPVKPCSKDSPENNEDCYFMSMYEIKYFLYNLLVALDALHSSGIMHRDIKPRNILISRGLASTCQEQGLQELNGTQGVRNTSAPRKRERKLRLIDFGLADFFVPGTRYNVRVASRHYKAPELLLGDELYDFAIDMWGVGCILAGLLFRREPFFKGDDNVDQLYKIALILGTDDLVTYYSSKRKILISPEVECALFGSPESKLSAAVSNPKPYPQSKRKSWIPFLPSDILSNESYRDALDLLDKILVYDHQKRFTAKDSMSHRFFNEVRCEIKMDN